GEPVAARAPDELGVLEPALASAVKRGAIAGGLEVPGFTVNVHGLAARLLDDLEARGARLVWGVPVHGLIRGVSGEVTGLDADTPLPATDHYVLSPGACGAGVLAGTRLGGLVHGLLGVWLTVPNLEPRLSTSLKIQPGQVPEQVNVTLAEDRERGPAIIFSSGYAYTGEQIPDLDHPGVQALFARLDDCARLFVPEAHARAHADGTLRASRRACI